jgi:hypothetical protein
MSKSQIGSVIYGLITLIPLQRIAQSYFFGALGTFSLNRLDQGFFVSDCDEDRDRIQPQKCPRYFEVEKVKKVIGWRKRDFRIRLNKV